tara:strand:+ start:2450 stop:3289 length:840 start_codon:yes stop_codon:yes gene_type:complete
MSVKAQRPRSSSYVNLLQKQRSINNSTAADAGLARSSRIPGAGVAFQSTVKYDKKKSLGAKPLVDKRPTTNQDDGDDFLTTAYNNVIEENNFIKASLKKSLFKDGSTRAMTGPDGEPLDILNKGDDVSKVDASSDSFLKALIKSESSGSSTAVNEKVDKKGKRKFVGFLQFGERRLLDYMEETGAEFTQDDFMDDKKLQEVVADWHIKDIDKEIKSLGALPKGFNNRNGLRAVAHLGGISGMKQFVKSRGKYDPDDGNKKKTNEVGTKLSDYYKKFSNL